MKFDDVVAKVRINDDGSGRVWIRGGPGVEVDVDFIVKCTIDALGLQVADDGTVCQVGFAGSPKPGWEPPGGLTRAKRTYRNGRGVRK